MKCTLRGAVVAGFAILLGACGGQTPSTPLRAAEAPGVTLTDPGLTVATTTPPVSTAPGTLSPAPVVRTFAVIVGLVGGVTADEEAKAHSIAGQARAAGYSDTRVQPLPGGRCSAKEGVWICGSGATGYAVVLREVTPPPGVGPDTNEETAWIESTNASAQSEAEARRFAPVGVIGPAVSRIDTLPT